MSFGPSFPKNKPRGAPQAVANAPPLLPHDQLFFPNNISERPKSKNYYVRGPPKAEPPPVRTKVEPPPVRTVPRYPIPPLQSPRQIIEEQKQREEAELREIEDEKRRKEMELEAIKKRWDEEAAEKERLERLEYARKMERRRERKRAKEREQARLREEKEKEAAAAKKVALAKKAAAKKKAEEIAKEAAIEKQREEARQYEAMRAIEEEALRTDLEKLAEELRDDDDSMLCTDGFGDVDCDFDDDQFNESDPTLSPPMSPQHHQQSSHGYSDLPRTMQAGSFHWK